MTGAVTIEGTRGRALTPDALEPLLVYGADREAQAERLRSATLLISAGESVIAAAVCRQLPRELRVEEIGMVRAHGDDEMADVVMDALETAALVAGSERLVVFSASRPLRRAMRLLGYVPQTVGQRLGFVHHVQSTEPALRHRRMVAETEA
jgi:hypothetical protein